MYLNQDDETRYTVIEHFVTEHSGLILIQLIIATRHTRHCIGTSHSHLPLTPKSLEELENLSCTQGICCLQKSVLRSVVEHSVGQDNVTGQIIMPGQCTYRSSI